MKPLAAPVPEVELVSCCICFADPAIPPVLFNCGHEVCGPCVVELERRANKRPREANFQCPFCKQQVIFYAVSVHGRAQALQFATAVEREECRRFMTEHMSQSADVQIRQEKQAPASRVNRAQAQSMFVDIFSRIPRTLIPQWEHNGNEFTYRLVSVFISIDYAERSEERSTYTSVRNRVARILGRAGMTVRRVGSDLILTLPVTSVDRFDALVWP